MLARAVLASTCLPVLEAVRAEWGGSIHPDTIVRDRRQGWRLDFNGHDELLCLLRAIQPFSIIKRAEINLFLAEFAPTMRAGKRKHLPLTIEQRTTRARVKVQLSALKRVGYPASATVN